MNGVDGVHKVGTAISELLENAVKYSNKSIIHMTIMNDEKNGHIAVSIFNYADENNAQKLVRMIDEMNSRDSLEYYIGRMRESILNKKKSAGLGLARIYHETNAIISASYNKSEKMVQVKAIISVI
jgi:hypothetical protein